jgi:hypothetical protein
LIREVFASGKTVTFAIKHVVGSEGHHDVIAEDDDDEGNEIDASDCFG